MKVLTICLLLVAVICRAQETNEITRKVYEGRAGEFRAESFFRAGKRVMVEYSTPNTQGVWSVTARAYFAGGQTVVIESDRNRDGFFETVIVFRSDTNEIEAFTRHRDGSVQPLSTQTLEALKKQDAAFSEFGKALSKEADPDQLEQALRDVRRKLSEAEREKAKEAK